MMKRTAYLSACVTLGLMINAIAWAQKPELVVQTGHADVIMSLAFSPDGRICASGSRDRTVKLWDTRTGQLLRTLVGHTGRVTRLVFSDDGQTLVSESEAGGSTADNDGDETDRLWEVATGKMVSVIPRGAFAFSPDGAIFAAVAGGDNVLGDTVSLWDAHTGRLLRRFGATFPLGSLTFSPDGSLIAGSVDQSRLDDEMARLGPKLTPANLKAWKETPQYKAAIRPTLWEVRSGRMVFRLNDCESVVFTTDSGLIIGDLKHVFSSADGRLLRSLDAGTIALAPNGETAVSWDGAQKFIVVDVPSNKLRYTFTGNYKADPAVSFSSDGGLLVINGTGVDGKPAQAEIRDVHTGHTARHMSFAAGRQLIDFSPDYSVVLLAREIKTDKPYESLTAFELWDAGSGQLLQQLGVPFMPGSGGAFEASPVFSSDGSLLAQAQAQSLKLFARNGDLLYTFSGSEDIAEALALSPDNRWLAVMKAPPIADGRYELWDVRGGSLNHVFAFRRTDDRPDTVVEFSRDSQFLYTADGRALNAATGQEAKGKAQELDELLQRLKISNSSRVRVTFSPNGKVLAVGLSVFGVEAGESTLKLYDVETAQPVRNNPEVVDTVKTIAFSPDGKLLAVTSGSGNAGFVSNQVFDLGTGQELTTFFDKNEEAAKDTNKASFLAFSPDSRIAVLQGRCTHDPLYCERSAVDSRRGPSLPVPALVELRDGRDGKLIRALRSGSAPALSAAYTADGKILVVGCEDATVKVWAAESGELLATLFSSRDDNWLVVTPDGLFDGSPTAWNQMMWRFNNDTFNYAPVEAFFGDFFYPGLLAEMFAGKRPKAPSDISQKDRRQPQVELALADAQANATLNARNVTVKINVAGRAADKDNKTGSGAQDVRLFRNGSLIRVWHGDVLKGQRSVTLEATIPIVAGENQLTAYAFNHDNIKSSDKSVVVNGADNPKRAGTLYVLAVGSNRYKSAGYDLRFALADVEEVSKQVKAYQDNLRNYAHTEIITLTDQEATKANIMLALQRFATGSQIDLPPGVSPSLSQQLIRIKTIEPEDGLVIYYAGHGTAIGQHFYLLPHDFVSGNEEQLRATSISDIELNEVLEGVDAGKLLMVIDACQSGQALGGEKEGRGPMNSKGLAQLAYDKGMYILTAAQSYQAALEVSRSQAGQKIEHGLLTFALLEGLTKAGKDSEGRITEREWMNYAVDQVPLMQTEEMKKRSAEIKQRSGSGQRSELVFVGGDNGAIDPEKRNVQRPRVFYRRELEDRPLIVAKQ